MYSVIDDILWCRVAPFGNVRVKGCLPPHRTLSQVTTSFIASSCQGIHRMRLIAWPYNPKQCFIAAPFRLIPRCSRRSVSRVDSLHSFLRFVCALSQTKSLALNNLWIDHLRQIYAWWMCFHTLRESYYYLNIEKSLNFSLSFVCILHSHFKPLLIRHFHAACIQAIT